MCTANPERKTLPGLRQNRNCLRYWLVHSNANKKKDLEVQFG